MELKAQYKQLQRDAKPSQDNYAELDLRIRNLSRLLKEVPLFQLKYALQKLISGPKSCTRQSRRRAALLTELLQRLRSA
jgi:hypothetical protein